MKTTEIKRNCAFQYAHTSPGFLQSTKIIEDKTSLTLDEAKNLWDKHYPDCAKKIKDGYSCEMVIWINMETPNSYGDSLEYISYDAQSNGTTIWEERRFYFTKNFQEKSDSANS
jgi:hypothetical protein